MITVKMMKKILENFDEKDIIVLSSDEEGNSYSPLESTGRYMFSINDRELYMSDDEDIPKKAKSAVVFFPQ